MFNLKRPSAYTLADTEKLINQGRWPKARRILRDTSFEQKYGGSISTASERDEKLWVAFCFQRALVELLTSDDTSDQARRYHAWAKASPEYTTELDGDFTRDVALACIRWGKLEKALMLIEKAEPNHTAPIRKALLISVRARWNSAKGNLNEAEEGFKEAHDLWEEAGAPSDHQWVMNSRYHWFKLRVSRGSVDYEMAQLILKTDPSFPRRFSVWLICRSITVANRLDNALQKLAAKAMRLRR